MIAASRIGCLRGRRHQGGHAGKGHRQIIQTAGSRRVPTAQDKNQCLWRYGLPCFKPVKAEDTVFALSGKTSNAPGAAGEHTLRLPAQAAAGRRAMLAESNRAERGIFPKVIRPVPPGSGTGARPRASAGNYSHNLRVSPLLSCENLCLHCAPCTTCHSVFLMIHSAY